MGGVEIGSPESGCAAGVHVMKTAEETPIRFRAMISSQTTIREDASRSTAFAEEKPPQKKPRRANHGTRSPPCVRLTHLAPRSTAEPEKGRSRPIGKGPPLGLASSPRRCHQSGKPWEDASR